MKIHNVIQGSPEWNALRATCDTASEASAMMGASKYTSRNELLRLKATASEKEFSDWAQEHLLDKGHAIEAKARPLAEEVIGEALYPCTATSDEPLGTGLPHLLASFDGLTMLENVCWEGKSWNEQKAAAVRAGGIPDEDYWQVVQQVMVANAERALYTVSDGTPDKFVYCWYERDERDEALLLRGWLLFHEDLAKYEYVEPVVQPVAAVVPGLPAINYKLNGLALTSNLDVFRQAAEKLVEESRKPLNTDQEFADREMLCKRFGEAEEKIKLLREQVLGEFKDVDQFTRELGAIGELIRQARLAGEKQVKDRKDQIRLDIRQKAEKDLAEYVAECNAKLGGKVVLPPVAGNFAGVMKGLRSLQSIQDKVDAELARVKLVTQALAEGMAANLALLREKAKGVEFLFRDAQELAQKDRETLALVIDQRIREHQDALAEQERQRQADEANSRAQLEAAVNQPAETEPQQAAPHYALPQDQPEAAPVQWPAGGYADGDAFRQPEQAEPDLLDTSGMSTTRVEVTDMRALVKAVAAGEVPISVLRVDLDALAQVSEARGQALPGTTWSKA